MTLSPLSAEELSQIRERAEKETQGPRQKCRCSKCVTAMRADIPRLLETVAYWQEEAERLKAERDARLVNSGHPPLADTNNSHIVTNWPWFGELDRAAREREANAKKRALSERAQGET